VFLDLVDVLSPAFLVRLLPFRPAIELGAVFLSSVLGLLSNLALLFSCVFEVSTLNLLRRLSFASAAGDCFLTVIFLAMRDVFGALIRRAGLVLGFVTVAAESGFDVLSLVATPEVFAELICLRGSGLVSLFTAGGVDFGLLIRVAMREVLAVFVRAGELGAGLVFAAAAGGLARRTDVVMREVFAGLTRLSGAGFGCFGARRAAGRDFGLLICVAMREVLAVFVRVGELVAGLVFTAAAGGLAGRTDVVMREVFAGLTRLGGAGFAGFGVVGAGEGLEILRAGVTLRGGAETLGGLERGADRLGLGALGLAAVGGGLLRLGRVEALGAD